MAAGAGTRMGAGGNKVLMKLGGMSVLRRTVEAFAGEVDGVMIVTRAQDIDAVWAMGLNAQVTTGGATRQASVLCGLRALPPEAAYVHVHDGARPFVSRDTIQRCLASAKAHGSGVASIPAKDTIKQVAADGSVLATPDRAALRLAQTPQTFPVATLRSAIEALDAQGITATDDAGAVEASGGKVYLVDGDERNIKLTTPEDIKMAEVWIENQPTVRIGHGYDVHRLVEGRRLILCGVEIHYEKGLLGHSDADVATHALMDALLGAAALGDIGRHFPDSDPQYKGISSLALLEKVMVLLRGRGYTLSNADVTIVAERPKLKGFIGEMTARIAKTMGVPPEQINIKATTTEGLGFEGEGLGISSHAVVVLTHP